VAVLIPEDISATAVPPGERKFHSFLKILFEFRPDVIGWHSVRVCGKEIDFSLLLQGILCTGMFWRYGAPLALASRSGAVE
jgi:hypothetical protein